MPSSHEWRAGLDPALLVGSTDDEILRGFLELVRGWRGAQSTLRLRQADVGVLVSILGTDAAEIERRLVAATKCDTTTARRCRLLLLASLATLSIGLVSATAAGAGAATYTPVAASSGTRPAASATVAPMVAARGALGGLVQQPAATPGSSIATSPAGTEAVLTLPSLGIDLPIIAGGQSVIDQGVVAHYTAPGWEPPVAAGAPGTYWLAAHHSTHGGPFAALPDVAIGAEIRVTTNDETFVYTVTSTEIVGLLPGDEAVYGTDPDASVILLQTCLDDVRRVLVHGTLTATS